MEKIRPLSKLLCQVEDVYLWFIFWPYDRSLVKFPCYSLLHCVDFSTRKE